MLEVLKPSISDSHWTALSRKREELSILPKKRTKNFINDYQNTLKDQLEYLKKDIAYHKKSIESHNRQMELILLSVTNKKLIEMKDESDND
jgi:seryl-tRNA synthetase